MPTIGEWLGSARAVVRLVVVWIDDDAYTGYGAEQSLRDAARIPVEEALRVSSACLLRIPEIARSGHFAFSDGGGGTVEAHSRGRGVTAHAARGRRRDCGVLVPGVRYLANETAVAVGPASALIMAVGLLGTGEPQAIVLVAFGLAVVAAGAYASFWLHRVREGRLPPARSPPADPGRRTRPARRPPRAR